MKRKRFRNVLASSLGGVLSLSQRPKPVFRTTLAIATRCNTDMRDDSRTGCHCWEPNSQLAGPHSFTVNCHPVLGSGRNLQWPSTLLYLVCLVCNNLATHTAGPGSTAARSSLPAVSAAIAPAPAGQVQLIQSTSGLFEWRFSCSAKAARCPCCGMAVIVEDEHPYVLLRPLMQPDQGLREMAAEQLFDEICDLASARLSQLGLLLPAVRRVAVEW